MPSPQSRAFLVLIAVLSGPLLAAAGQDTPRKLFEAGRYDAAIERAAADTSPASTYINGLAHLKLNQVDAAKNSFRQLDGGGEAWQAVGQSAVALAEGNREGALAAARTAVARNAGLAEAHYQLGLVLDQAGDNAAAADAFAKAAEVDPQMAYAHYYAGMNYYRARRIDRMAVYFENFLKLAPNAPERPAVESIMKTVRG